VTVAVPPAAGTPWRPREQPPTTVAAGGHATRLPSEAARRGPALLNQQFWLWGQDIQRPGGNLLLQHGFAKHRPPDGVKASTRYELTLDDGGQIDLWGFGLLYRDPDLGGLYLGRFKLAPRLTAAAPVAAWSPGELGPIVAPVAADEWARTGALLVPALRWIAAYEAWVVAATGADYRRRCLAAWPRPACPAGEIAARWLRLAHRCAGSQRRVAGPGASGVVPTRRLGPGLA